MEDGLEEYIKENIKILINSKFHKVSELKK